MADGGAKALFSEISSIDQSSGRTAGLRHVESTEKNRGGGGVVRIEKKEEKVELGKEARKELKDDKRWFIEYQTGENGPVMVDDEDGPKHEVYISHCHGATIVLNFKCKVLMIDNCTKTNVVFTGSISGAEIVSCKSVKVQCKEKCPSFGIDKTDGITVYTSFEGRHTKITTAKSSEMNLSFPLGADDEAEWTEVPVPEQFITTIKDDGTLDTVVSDIYSG